MKMCSVKNKHNKRTIQLFLLSCLSETSKETEDVNESKEKHLIRQNVAFSSVRPRKTSIGRGHRLPLMTGGGGHNTPSWFLPGIHHHIFSVSPGFRAWSVRETRQICVEGVGRPTLIGGGGRMRTAAAGGGCWSTLVLSSTDNTLHIIILMPASLHNGASVDAPPRAQHARSGLREVSVTARRARACSRVFGVLKVKAALCACSASHVWRYKRHMPPR